MARRARARFIRPAPRTKMWIGWGVGLTALTASTLHSVGVYTAGALALRPFTILRTRGIVKYFSDQIVANESPFGVLGSIVVTDTAAALGVTAVPNPGDNPEASWFTYQACMARVEVGDGTGFDGNFGAEYIIDDKSMRKVGPDDDVNLLFDQSAALGATLFTLGRTLIQLH